MDEIKTDNKHIKVAGKLSSLPRKHISANRRKSYRDPFFYHSNF